MCIKRQRRISAATVVVIGVLLVSHAAPAQQTAGKAASATPTDDATAKPTPMKPEELEALTAQIALYPDSVLAQVLMASTYPLEIVQADRWIKDEKNKKLKDDALAKELEKLDWDPSVKSLIQFPQVLDMMSKQLDWTTKLGDAFIADQNAVMAAVQRLRNKAHEQGNLKDSEQQKIVIEKPDPAQVVVVESAPQPPQIIKIESPSPQVIYVPTYNPTVVYGTWPYPYYPPPAPYYPPGYVAGSALWFGAGVALGAAWGHAWGGCNWGHGDCDVDIDVDRNTNFNKNINREKYKQNMTNRQTDRQANRGDGTRGQGTRGQGGQGRFQHDAAHRKGVSYRDQGTANRFADAGTRDAAKARESFRGRAETGRQDIGRGGASGFQRDLASGRTQAGRNTAGLSDRSTVGGGGRDSLGGRTGSSSGNRSSVGGNGSGSGSGSRGSAFDGAGRTSGSSARNYSNRGSSSRNSTSSGSRSRGSSGGFSSGGSRGGGGSRGFSGGGRGGGGRGGGGRR